MKFSFGRTEQNTILSVILLWIVILVVCVPVFLSHGLFPPVSKKRLKNTSNIQLLQDDYMVVECSLEVQVHIPLIKTMKTKKWILQIIV